MLPAGEAQRERAAPSAGTDNPCFNPLCPACASQRCHTAQEWKNHPLAGHGYVQGHGWTHPEAARLHNKEAQRTANASHAARPGTPEVKHHGA